MYKNIFTFYKDLISLRKNHPAFRMTTGEMVNEHFRFKEFNEDENLIGFSISGNANSDSWSDIQVIFNGSESSESVSIPQGNWTKVIEGEIVKEQGFGSFSGNKIIVPPYSALVLVDTPSI